MKSDPDCLLYYLCLANTEIIIILIDTHQMTSHCSHNQRKVYQKNLIRRVKESDAPYLIQRNGPAMLGNKNINEAKHISTEEANLSLRDKLKPQKTALILVN